MQKVLRMVPPISRRQKQLPLFARPQCNPRWADLSPDIQQKTMPLLAQLLRQHRRIAAETKSHRSCAMSEKIMPHHIGRKAILYVRQSSTFQVQNNLESQKLQYAMRDRLWSFGWCEIEVIDEDLGRSASGTVTRAGLERMVAEGLAVCTQQPRMAEAGGSLSCGGYAIDRSRDGV